MTSVSGCRVLVVEDEFYLATDVEEALLKAGATVIGPYPDQEGALTALAGERLDCAVLDVNLGQGASFSLADRLQEAGVPFLFFTGYDRGVIPPRFAEVQRLEKPAGGIHLLRAVEQLCATVARP